MTAGISPETIRAAVDAPGLLLIAAKIATGTLTQADKDKMAEQLEAVAARVDRLAGLNQRTGTVADIPDSELVRRVVLNAHMGTEPRRPRWSVVSDRTSLGSTYAGQLCVRFGLDPDEPVGTDPEPEEETDE